MVAGSLAENLYRDVAPVNGTAKEVPVLLRIDTPIEVDYYLHGGILPFVLRDLVAQTASAKVTA